MKYRAISTLAGLVKLLSSAPQVIVDSLCINLSEAWPRFYHLCVFSRRKLRPTRWRRTLKMQSFISLIFLLGFLLLSERLFPDEWQDTIRSGMCGAGTGYYRSVEEHRSRTHCAFGQRPLL